MKFTATAKRHLPAVDLPCDSAYTAAHALRRSAPGGDSAVSMTVMPYASGTTVVSQTDYGTYTTCNR